MQIVKELAGCQHDPNFVVHGGPAVWLAVETTHVDGSSSGFTVAQAKMVCWGVWAFLLGFLRKRWCDCHNPR